VAIKLAHADPSPSRLTHEYNVYKSTTGCKGISPVRWYGKEGPYEVIILDYLGTSLGDLISAQQFNSAQCFLYASQMVRLLCIYVRTGISLSSWDSFQQSNLYIVETISIVTSSQETS
jgi:hypothetical protein